ncbi:MAG TPA: ABC transporter substrate-binding protein [Verrucomicrobiae bacterium]|nr:ABC transporter substrate-binding protein [Verrucomicrobiae bacterium]
MTPGKQLPKHQRLQVVELAVFFFCTLLLLGGCARTSDTRTSDGRILVDYWEKWTGFESDAMQAVVDDFNHSQNRILVQYTPVGEIERKLMLATAGGDPPDVAGVFDSTITGFSEKGALTPLDKLAARAGIKAEDYIPVFWKECRNHGFLWALPSTPWSAALHWNKKLFREAGLDPEKPPQSLDELEKMSEQLTIVDIRRGNKVMHIRYPELTEQEKEVKNFKLVQTGQDPQQPGWWMPLWVYWFGGRLWDGQRRITANDPGNVQCFEWLRSQSEKYGVENRRSLGASYGNFDSPQNPFLTGQIAMTFQGEWMYNFIEQYAPQMQWGAAPFPAKDPQKYPLVTLAETDVLVIPKGARHVKEAFEFIRYVNTQGPMEKLCLGQRKFSPLAKVSDGFIKNHPNPYIKTFIQLANSPNAHFAPRLSVWAEYNDEMNVAVDQVIGLITSPQAALDAVQQRMQWRLDRVTRRWDAVQSERLKEWSSYDPR